jgi:hypothetical protein
VRLDRCGLRSLVGYTARRATAERLWLLDAVAALGPGLLVLWADEARLPGETPAAVRMTRLKGANDPAARSAARCAMRRPARTGP